MRNLPSLGEPSSIGATVLGVVAVVLVAAVLTDRGLPFISGDRAAFIALAVVGVTMCAIGGIGTTTQGLGWTHPLSIVGIVLGIGALAVVGLVLSGTTGPFTSLAGNLSGSAAVAMSADRAAFITLAGIMLVKWVLGFSQYFLGR